MKRKKYIKIVSGMLILIFVLGISLTTNAAANSMPGVENTITDNFVSVDGVKYDSHAKGGKAKMLIYFNSYCQNCIYTFEYMKQLGWLHDEIDIIARDVNNNSKEEVMQFRTEHGSQGTVFCSGEGVGKFYDYARLAGEQGSTYAYPLIIYINAQDRVCGYTMGPLNSDEMEQKVTQFIKKKTGWQRVGQTWYYYGSDGVMATNWKKIGASWYYFEGSGAMVTGWKKVGASWYYLSGSGAMVTGWKKIGANWYYLSGSGAMAVGWKKIGASWYYFNSSGAMAVGWKKLGEKWYYLNPDGTMVTGRIQIGGKWYQFNSSGVWVR